jgi:hypothetical protein
MISSQTLDDIDIIMITVISLLITPRKGLVWKVQMFLTNFEASNREENKDLMAFFVVDGHLVSVGTKFFRMS